MTAVKTLERAVNRATALPRATQEQLARELLERIESLENLRDAVHLGAAQLDAGLGVELDMEDVIGAARREHGKG